MKALLNETFMGLKGLGYECKQLTDKLGLPNIMLNQVSKGEIKQAIARDSNADLKEEMQNSKKVGDRWMDNTYLKYMSLLNSRIWMRYRARSITEVKVNNKRSFTDLSCRFCSDNTQESQEHYLVVSFQSRRCVLLLNTVEDLAFYLHIFDQKT